MRVVLADDHELVRNGLRFYLERLAPEVAVVEASTLEEALTAAKTASTDLIILDLAMPGMNGTAGVEQMRARHPNVPLVVLSGRTGREDILGALNRGANGYLPKTLSGKAMLAALRLVLSGETFVPSILMDERNRAGGRADQLGAAPGLDALTDRERDVLDFLCQGKSNKEIARDLAIREVTVKVHVGNIMRKLGASNRTQAVRLALDLKAKA
ncbi:MAG: response regulator [Alphaproteobacteria bacterium]